MTIRWQNRLVGGAALALLATGIAGAAAQSEPSASSASVPRNWNYEIKDGKRVPKGHRVTQADGSWREEMRQGPCVTVKQKTANGDYSETRKCD